MMVLKKIDLSAINLKVPVSDQIFRNKCILNGNYSAVALTMACFPR